MPLRSESVGAGKSLSEYEGINPALRPLRTAAAPARASHPAPERGKREDQDRDGAASEGSSRSVRKKECGRYVRASMTLEAAIVVPLFIFFIMNILFVMEMVRLQSGLQAALQQTGEQICELAYYTRFGVGSGENGEGDGGGLPAEAGGAEGLGSGDALSFALSEAYVRSRVVSYLGKSYLGSTCLKGGAGGLSFAGCRIMTEGDRVDLIVNYRIRPFVRVLAPAQFPMQARFSGHAWVGWTEGSGCGAGSTGSSAGEKVYVTKYGSVYHDDPDCIYLNPQVRSVPGSEVDNCRSGDGSKYYPCEYCHPDRNGTVYITKEGNRYHSNTQCGAIRRTIRQVDSETAQNNLPPCPKCGNKH